MDPYRTSEPPARAQSVSEPTLTVAFALFAVVSAVRVGGAILGGEVFGAEATMALMVVVAATIAAARGLAHGARSALHRRSAKRARSSRTLPT